ncbi:MAG: hypothetical protein DSY76_01990 [Bacteroidetes bacterium]|nr:MAG: hypothetical protein DSY76_01990 [Bacteroidota bacterium]
MSLVVYKSSAGSGKTTTLVNEYLSLALLKPERFSSIIALTFTIKATTEMKERVFQVLDKIIHLDEHKDDLGLLSGLKHIQDRTELSIPEIQTRAKKLLKNILHNYSDFAFSTIDSFVMSIVRSFAHDLNLPLDFNVDLDTDFIIEQAVVMLFENIGKNDALTDFLIQYILQKADSEGNLRIQGELEELGKILFDSSNYQSIEKLSNIDLKQFSSVRNSLQADIAKYEKVLITEARKGLKLIDDNNIPHKNFSSSTIPKQFIKILNKDFSLNPKAIENPEENLFYTKGNKKKLDITAPIDSIRDALVEILNTIRNHRDLYEADYIDKVLIYEKINPLALLSEIKHQLDIYKEENNVIHISESNKMISDIVLNEHIPFIYERVGRRYHHFLIDEFQDTSVIQWNNLIPLIDNALADGNFNMLVGDAKQSIYRWRDGDVDQFINLPKIKNANSSEIMKERAKSIERNYRKENLQNNYRSELNIIEFNNTFFKYLAENEYGLNSERIAKIYEKHEQIPAKTKDNGRVVLRHFPEKGEISYEEGLVKQVDELLNQNYQLKDIAIIARTKKVLERNSDILIKHGYKVISNETLYIAKNPIVNLITSILYFVGNNNRKNHFLNCIHLLNKLHNKEQKAALENINSSLKKLGGNDDMNILVRAIAEFGFKLSSNQLQELQAYDLAEYIISKLHLSNPANPFVQSLLNNILENSQKNGSGIHAFIDFWELKKEKLSIQLPENIDAIKLLTIHKSKGLEFPVVIFPANGFRRRKGSFHWVNPKEVGIETLETAMVNHKAALEASSFKDQYLDEEDKLNMDDINMIYVACTRPTEQLIIFSEDKKDNIWKKIKDFNIENDKFITLDDNHKVYGRFSKHIQKNEEVQENVIKKTLSTSWVNKFHLKQSLKTKLSENTLARIEKGKTIHAILSHIRSTDDIEPTLTKFILQGIISSKEKVYYSEEIKRIITDEKIRDYFSKNNREINENSIILPDGNQLRPDKVILRENKTIIIDYKLSNYTSLSETEQKKHFSQLQNYQNILKEMKYPSIEAHLIYIGENIFDIIVPD